MAKGVAGGDVDEEEGEAGAGDGVPAKFGRGGGDAGDESGVAEPREVVATSTGAQAGRQRRLEAAGAEEREGRRRERSSGGLRGKRRASRGRRGHCDAGGGDGATGWRSDGIFSSPDLSLVEPLADFVWVAALEDGASVPELRIVHIFGVNLIEVTHFTLCVEISSSLLGYHACHHENIMLVIYF
uniref:BKRF1 encodes EBNA-1 protein-like n=1 Tax=Oryza sativa subsp. japonica TaxID=39947 RepID=Q69KH9_ORYSJ|nr:BKRF1 encodes EBNA-1 protein-like [Oryza sativa Japonica Group]BAD36561.1 BKRF1 encodes EBNA-1 protein-like [Oryza sativa Japonica Group]